MSMRVRCSNPESERPKSLEETQSSTVNNLGYRCECDGCSKIPSKADAPCIGQCCALNNPHCLINVETELWV